MSVTPEQLALLLQATRDCALDQIAQGERLIPFAGRVGLDGEIAFVRFAEPDTDRPLEEIYAETRAIIAGEAARGELLAASLLAAVRVEESEDGIDEALHVHVEAPGYSRQVLAPYKVEPPHAEGEQGSLVLGEMVPSATEPVIFAS